MNINWLSRGEGNMLDPLDVVVEPASDAVVDTDAEDRTAARTGAGELKNLLTSSGYTIDELAATIGIPADILKRFVEKDVPVPFYLSHRIRAVLNGIVRLFLMVVL